ncbi:GLPGLI family protein [Leeuwenhoekiella sp. LLG6367-2.1]|uniref:GLPGLI family protein n=1 Tax=Leeuwenhoekiella sp. LLG6367-2.1 TaxID=3160833 RepID=UPI00387080B4|tara:strand:+ start:271 stop:1014 length:744 start_codon:yes stop_codon:yes gene_type:complete
MNDRKIFIYTVLLNLFFIQSVSAQHNYKVTYGISKAKMHGSLDSLDDRGKIFFGKVFDYAQNLNYSLTTSSTESFFEEEADLQKGDLTALESILIKSAKRFPSFHKAVYISYTKDSITFIKNLVGKDFYVKRGLFDFSWEIKDDQKVILGYQARRALGSYYEPVTGKTLDVEAWFLPSIPLSSGPDIFVGLPGLIVEIEHKGAIVSARKIESLKNIEIEKIENKHPMSQNEFDRLLISLKSKFIDNQ